MAKVKTDIIEVQGTPISVQARDQGEFISPTDMVRNFYGAACSSSSGSRPRTRLSFWGSGSASTARISFSFSIRGN